VGGNTKPLREGRGEFSRCKALILAAIRGIGVGGRKKGAPGPIRRDGQSSSSTSNPSLAEAVASQKGRSGGFVYLLRALAKSAKEGGLRSGGADSSNSVTTAGRGSVKRGVLHVPPFISLGGFDRSSVGNIKNLPAPLRKTVSMRAGEQRLMGLPFAPRLGRMWEDRRR